jgi:hypothetical protein
MQVHVFFALIYSYYHVPCRGYLAPEFHSGGRLSPGASRAASEKKLHMHRVPSRKGGGLQRSRVPLAHRSRLLSACADGEEGGRSSLAFPSRGRRWLGKEGEARRSSELAVGLQQGCTSLARGTAPAPWWSSRSMPAAVELEIDVDAVDPDLDPAPPELVHHRRRSRWCGYRRRPQGRRRREEHGRARRRWGGPPLPLI